ncbi:MAG: putative zinc-binding protein [Bacteroidota bacterium]|nr:putative zinc-binding protein [Bacteroidota bacterium]
METNEKETHSTPQANKLVLACSGGSDLGELSDRVARKLRDKGFYNMKCLAMVGAGHKELIDTIKSSETLVIDGCPVDCGRKIMEEAWLTGYHYIRLTDLGYVKGETRVNNEIIEQVCTRIMEGPNLQKIEQIKPSSPTCCK